MKMKLLSQKKCKKRKEREEVVASCKTSKRLFPMDDEPDMKLKILLLSLKDHLLSEYGYPWTIINGYDTQPLQDVVETALTNFASPSQKNEEEAVVASCKTSKPLQMDKSVEKEMKCEKRKGREVQSKKKKRKERAEVVSSSKSCKTSKPLPLDKSGEKEMKLVKSVRGGFAVPGCGEVGRIIVSGYDIGLPRKVVETALRNHFSNCGVITDVFVPKSYRRSTADAKQLDPRSYIYFVGEGAVDKALLLNGTDVGGWTVNIEPYPFEPDAKHTIWLTAEGFDTSVSKTEIKYALINHFSSCGEVDVLCVVEGQAELLVTGEDAAEEVPKLDGSSFMGDHKLVLRNVCYFYIQTAHTRPKGLNCGRK